MPTILLVDDDVHLLGALSTSLSDAGFTVLQANRLDVAGRMVSSDVIDLVVLESAIEHGQGWEFLRELIELRGVPVIVLSSHASEEDVVAAFNLGASDFLSKPYRTQELLARVRSRLPIVTPTPRASEAVPPAPAPSYAAVRDEVDSPLFMDMAAEHSMLQERMSAEVYEGDIEELPLSQRLRTARQRLKLSLVQIELDTKLRIWYVQAMEEGRFGMLPRGMVEGMLRTYASYLGLNQQRALADFRAEYVDAPVQPLAYLGGRPEPREFPQWVAVVAAALLALALGGGGIWYFASDQMQALGSNLRVMVSRPTSTPVPSPTPWPTLTPTRTPNPTATARPTATPTPEPTPVPPPVETTTATTP